MPEPGLRHLTAASVVGDPRRGPARTQGQAGGARDATLLETAVAAPQATSEGDPLIADLVEVAAAYLFYLCRNHPFVDGNKRTALAACLVFLAANGRLPDERVAMRDPDAWEAFVQDVAASRVDRMQTTRRLKQLLRGGPPRRRR